MGYRKEYCAYLCGWKTKKTQVYEFRDEGPTARERQDLSNGKHSVAYIIITIWT